MSQESSETEHDAWAPPQADPPVKFSPYGRRFRANWMIVWGIISPTCFLIAASQHTGVDMWQSGSFGTYCLLVYQFEALRWVYPLILFSVIGLVVNVFRDRTQKPPVWLTAAVISGAVLWLELYIAWWGGMTHEFSGSAPFFCTVIACPIVGFLLTQPFVAITGIIVTKAKPTGHTRKEWELYGGFYVAVMFIAVMATVAWWPGIAIAGLVCSAPLALTSYVWASIDIWRSFDKQWRISISSLLIVFAWLSANLAAWRMAIVQAIEAYNRLPTDPPSGCYIVTASACGHRRFVGSQDVGQDFPVNRQLQRLKAAELLLAVTCPRLHRWLRKHYNRIGPQLARRIRNPWLADCTYLLLKPLEWAMILLLWFARVPRSSIRQVYQSKVGCVERKRNAP